MIKGLIIGFILGVVVVAAGTYYYFASGKAPVAVADPMMPFERKMATMALDAHIDREHVGEPLLPADEPNLLAGADVYQKNCAMCHGLPGHPSGLSNIMFPKPTEAEWTHRSPHWRPQSGRQAASAGVSIDQGAFRQSKEEKMTI